MNGQDFGEAGEADVPGDSPFWRMADIGQINALGRLFWVGVDGLLELGDGAGCPPFEGRRRGFGRFCFQHFLGVDKPAFFALEVVDVLRLEHAVKARVQTG